MRFRRRAMAGGLLLAAACAGQHVTTDYSPSIEFSHYRTFALVMPPDSSGSQQLLDQRVRNSVETQLLAKGMTQTDRRHADLYVGYGMVDKSHREVYSDDDGWGGAVPGAGVTGASAWRGR